MEEIEVKFDEKQLPLEYLIQPGHHHPLGATADDTGVNFALYSAHATAVELCFYSENKETSRTSLKNRSGHVWHAYISGIKPGQEYGYRVYGAYDPRNGFRFNPNKLLIDPYSKAVSETINIEPSFFGFIEDLQDDLVIDETDNGAFIPRSVVINTTYDWEGDKLLKTNIHQSIFYELHVKGFTKLNEEIPEDIRGTYAGLAHPSVIKYLKNLGVTAVELLPVQLFGTDRSLIKNNLTNYWGYNTIGFFAIEPRYSSAIKPYDQLCEFKTMVKEYHKAGLEVILDVVYNHSAEGNHLGPTLSFKGIDNSTYYRLTDDKRFYMDYTGTGNTFDSTNFEVLRLIMDSLRYWVTEMHIDGFRFDLAVTLARGNHNENSWGSFFALIHQDPILSHVKLIAEPWDIGTNGYQLGNFPDRWIEWNDKYRDTVRDYWRAESSFSAFSKFFCGSKDIFAAKQHPYSLNYITAHDGFTLLDLLSYNQKHNVANGEDNRDGHNDNRSFNWGVEGPSTSVAITKVRSQQQRNMLTTLLLSKGIPMLLAGDEIGRSQRGNNNAYCQDNEISWVNWNDTDQDLLVFARKLIELRKTYAVFRMHETLSWFMPDGEEGDSNLHGDFLAFAAYLKGEQEAFYILFNASNEEISYKLPKSDGALSWQKIIDTGLLSEPVNTLSFNPDGSITLASHSIMLLKKG
jgi:isoamylase